MPEINGIRVPFLPAGGADRVAKPQIRQKPEGVSGKFDSMFGRELNRLKFSNHAKARIQSRDLDVSVSDMNRLQGAFESAKAKGAKDSLILLDNKAFIVNVANKTIITAMDQKTMDQKVVTNIDSAVIA
jgi:flagellar operon protein